MTSTIFLIGNIGFSGVVFPLVSSLGLRWAVTMAMALASLGALLRVLVNQSFAFVLIGQLFLGMACNFVYNTNTQFCFNWFSPKSRPLYLSLVSVMNILGSGIGNSVPFIFIDDNEAKASDIRSSIVQYNLAIFAFVVTLTILTAFLFRDKPPQDHKQPSVPANRSAILDENSTYLQQSFTYLKRAAASRLFRTYLILYTIANSNICLLGSVINIAIEYFGFTSVD